MTSYLQDFIIREKKLPTDNILYVFDTNYFLYSLQVTKKEECTNYLEALKKHKGNIYIPFMVYMEFIINSDNIIKETDNISITPEQMIPEINKALTSIISDKDELITELTQKVELQSKNHLNINNIHASIPYLEQAQSFLDNKINTISDEVFPIIEQANTKLRTAVTAISSGNTSSTDNALDYKSFIYEYLNDLDTFFTNDKAIGKEYDQKLIDSWSDLVRSRFSSGIGPGYKDSKKDTHNKTHRFSNLTWTDSFGDAFIWLDMLYLMKESKDLDKYDKVVFVSSDAKEDWVHPKGSNFIKLNLQYEFKKETKLRIEKIKTKEFLKMSGFDSSSKDIDDDIVDLNDNIDDDTVDLNDDIDDLNDNIDDDTVDLNDDIDNNTGLSKDSIINKSNGSVNLLTPLAKLADNRDTIIVPARSQGFHNVFMGQNQWYSIRIANSKIPSLKYIAVYRTYPFSKITHIAKIKEIITSPEDPTKKAVIFKGPATELRNPIPLGTDPQAMQSARYTSFKKFNNAQNLDDLF